jgi:hypothetical protein
MSNTSTEEIEQAQRHYLRHAEERAVFHADPEVQAIVADAPVESFHSTLRGLDQSLTVYRLQHTSD